MKSIIGTTVKGPLALAVIAALAAGCAPQERVEYVAKAEPSWVGPAGPAGPTRAADPQGSIGPTGAQGPPAAVGQGGRWSVYRGYDFSTARDDIHDADRTKAAQVAEYMSRNPTHKLALDGLSNRRVVAVRDALISAGVPAFKIQTGAYGDPNLRTDRHVAVLVSN